MPVGTPPAGPGPEGTPGHFAHTEWAEAAIAALDAEKVAVATLGKWATAPALTVVQGVTVTHSVVTSRYVRIGNTVHFQCRLTITGAGTAGQTVYVTLPVNAATINGGQIGNGLIIFGTAHYTGFARFEAAGQRVSLKNPTDTTASAGMGAAGPSAALANNDQLHLNLTYEAAT